MTSRDLLFKESRALASVAVSENPRLNLEYFKYLGKHRRFGFNSAYFKEFIDYPIYNDFDLSETLRSNYSYLDLRLQYTLNRNSYVGLSHQFNSSRLKTIEQPDVTFKTKNRYFHSYLTYQYNNVDKKYFTTKGLRIRANAGVVYRQRVDYSTVEDGVETPTDTALFDTEDYGRLFVKVDRYSPLRPKLVFVQNLTVGYSTSDSPFLTNGFQLGGVGENLINQVPFYGLNDAEVKTGSVASLLLGLQYKLAKSVYLTGRVNLALYNFHNQSLSADDNFLSGYGLTFGFDSAIGPIEITSMYCDQDGRLRTNLNLGFRFLNQ
jgi:NTE family protein